MVRINNQDYDVKVGDVFVLKSSNTPYVITKIVRGDAYYRTPGGEIYMIMIEKLCRLCRKL